MQILIKIYVMQTTTLKDHCLIYQQYLQMQYQFGKLKRTFGVL